MNLIGKYSNFTILKLNFEYDSEGDIICSTIKENSLPGSDNIVASYYLNNNMIVCVFFTNFKI